MNRDEETSLLLAARNGHTSVCKLFIARDADIQRVNHQGSGNRLPSHYLL